MDDGQIDGGRLQLPGRRCFERPKASVADRVFDSPDLYDEFEVDSRTCRRGACQMSGPLLVSRAALLAALASSRREDEAVSFATAALAAGSSEELLLSAVERQDLLEIYGRRLSRQRQPPSGLLGAERLLDDFNLSKTKVLLALTLEHDGRVTTVWFDDEGRRLVGIGSGVDKRSL